MQYYWKIPFISRAIYSIWKIDAQRKYSMCQDWITPDQKLLEIGSGPGSIIEIFRGHGHDVQGLDIADNSISPNLKPDIYDGETMPYADKHFDVSLLLTVLHHVPQPDDILREAMRISRRIIIIEDVYDTPFQAAYTKLTDSITNLEFIGHPHSNRSDAEWRATFERFGWTLRHHKIYPLAKLFQQAIYVVEP